MGTRIKQFQIKNDSIDSTKIADGDIIDADISASADIQQSKILDLETDLEAKINLSGDEFTGPITLHDLPTDDFHATPKQFIESLISTTSIASYQYLPDISLETPTSLIEIHPYTFAVNENIQTNNIITTLDPNNAADYDTYVTTSGMYYIYATGTEFKISKVTPIFFNGTWVNNLTDKWRAVCSLVRISNGGNFHPFKKIGKYNRFRKYILLSSQSTPSGTFLRNTYGGPGTEGAIVTGLVYAGNHSGGTLSATISFYEPISTTKIDEFNFLVNGTWNASQNWQMVIAPTEISSNIPRIKYSVSGTFRWATLIYQLGYIERF